MAFTLPPRTGSDFSNLGAGASTEPSVDPSAGASPAPPVANGDAIEDMKDIINITSSARRLAMKYPSAIPAVQNITAAVQDIQNAIMQVQPPTEPAAPPQ